MGFITGKTKGLEIRMIHRFNIFEIVNHENINFDHIVDGAIFSDGSVTVQWIMTKHKIEYKNLDDFREDLATRPVPLKTHWTWLDGEVE